MLSSMKMLESNEGNIVRVYTSKRPLIRQIEHGRRVRTCARSQTEGSHDFCHREASGTYLVPADG